MFREFQPRDRGTARNSRDPQRLAAPGDPDPAVRRRARGSARPSRIRLGALRHVLPGPPARDRPRSSAGRRRQHRRPAGLLRDRGAGPSSPSRSAPAARSRPRGSIENGIGRPIRRGDPRRSRLRAHGRGAHGAMVDRYYPIAQQHLRCVRHIAGSVLRFPRQHLQTPFEPLPLPLQLVPGVLRLLLAQVELRSSSRRCFSFSYSPWSRSLTSLMPSSPFEREARRPAPLVKAACETGPAHSDRRTPEGCGPRPALHAPAAGWS